MILKFLYIFLDDAESCPVTKNLGLKYIYFLQKESLHTSSLPSLRGNDLLLY